MPYRILTQDAGGVRTHKRTNACSVPCLLVALLAVSPQASAQVAPAKVGAPGNTSPTTASCVSLGGLATVSASKMIWLEEVDAWNHHYGLRGNAQLRLKDAAVTQSGAVAPQDTGESSDWPEIDPRSTLVVHFGNADPCTPPFRVRLRGTVRRQSGSSRSLEIPRYFQAGVAQAEPQSRTFAWRSAKRILTGVSSELAVALQDSRTGSPLPDQSAARVREPKAEAARKGLDTLRTLMISLERSRIASIYLSTSVTVRSQLTPQDTIKADSAVVLQRSTALLTSRLDSVRDAQANLIRLLDTEDRKQQVAVSKEQLRKLLAVPQTLLAIRLLRQPAYAPALRELAAQVEAEYATLESLFLRLDSAFTGGSTVLSKLDGQGGEAEGIGDVIRASTVLRMAESELLTQALLATKKAAASSTIVSEPLLLPNAEIPLRGSSVADGEQVSLEVSFIADDGAVLESASYELSVVKLGGAVRNIRDVALFLNRCAGGSSLKRPCNTSSQSVESAANDIRRELLGSNGTRLDLLRLDAIARSQDIPSQDRYIPVPGVVFEALFRPRVLKSDGTPMRVFKKTVRTLGMSAGLSVSFVSFTDRRVTVNAPTTDQLRLFYSTTDSASRLAMADTLFRLGSSDVSRQELSLAPAAHFGFFDGALSWAFGVNLRANQGRFFHAIGFSFLGLTEAGARLISSLK